MAARKFHTLEVGGSSPPPATIQQYQTTMAGTIESKVKQTILQEPIEVTIGGVLYKAAPPSVATLICVSEAVSLLPHIRLEPEKVVDEVLSVAKDCRPLGDIVAILVLGAKGLTETRREVKTVEKRRFCGLIKEQEQVEVVEVIDHKSNLAKTILEELSPRELKTLVGTLLEKMEIGHFFGLTTSLIEANLLRPTREVVTTASGQ